MVSTFYIFQFVFNLGQQIFSWKAFSKLSLGEELQRNAKSSSKLMASLRVNRLIRLIERLIESIVITKEIFVCTFKWS